MSYPRAGGPKWGADTVLLCLPPIVRKGGDGVYVTLLVLKEEKGPEERKASMCILLLLRVDTDPRKMERAREGFVLFVMERT
ncbi:hypothetical protein CDL15_Pgr029178 [Punica granatum]|uniref:Uncharacterized protein n=1 Tax=Punica granatum TaxID=22663 RepID=A0A218XCZ2_PUNGR|nr:hypothetical protein CDL15_Pgr029178 [Punica granatum]